jgi:hypothetical protein
LPGRVGKLLDSTKFNLFLSTGAFKRYSLRSRFVHLLRVLPHGAGRPSAPAGRRSCVAPGRRKIPHCGAGSWLAWTARRAAAARHSYALLDVALSSRHALYDLPSVLETEESCSPHVLSGARSSRAFLPPRPTVARPPRALGHQGFLFCKCQALLPLSRASPQGRSVAHLHNSPSTFVFQVRKAKQSLLSHNQYE